MKKESYLAKDVASYSKSNLVHDDGEDYAGDQSYVKHANIRIARYFSIKNVYFPELVIREAPVDFRPKGKAGQ